MIERPRRYQQLGTPFAAVMSPWSNRFDWHGFEHVDCRFVLTSAVEIVAVDFPNRPHARALNFRARHCKDFRVESLVSTFCGVGNPRFCG